MLFLRAMFSSPLPYDLNIFGYGESEDKALREICESIIEHYEHIMVNQNKLELLLRRDWDFLSRMIKETEAITCK